MKFLLVFFIIVIFSGSFIFFQFLQSENNIEIYLKNSVPYVGADIPRASGINGDGIKIAVIDTGVDFNHPDLLGWGPDGKVIGGYNFVQKDQLPIDTDGHGTQVAGVIAADGEVFGIAPKSKILAYKVSEDGDGVSSDLVVRAIKKAVEDGADIINISLGEDKTDVGIDHAVNYALEKGVFVVAAAGNDGPELETIGSPGSNVRSITVGATYNNLESSLVATLEVNKKPYTVIPMIGSIKLEPITEKIIFGGYGKIEDLEKIDVKDSILIVKRGSDVDGEMLYFSVKENNAANAGAKALIVYNNEPGMFLGELIHEFIDENYKPRIPVVSIDEKEGLEIKKLIKNETKASMHLFYNPDFVVHFSSRGPVSPFYMKPEIVAPGAYISTTQNDTGYNVASGTSYAAPHVSGAIALLLQKNPELSHNEIKSLLLTTVEPVSDAYGKEFSIHDTGSGRLDIENAFNAKLIVMPPNFIVNVSSDNVIAEKQFELKLIDGVLDNLDVEFKGPEFIKFSYFIENNFLKIKMTMIKENFGDHEGKIIINHDNTKYTIPFLLHYTPGSISVNQENSKLSFDIYHPEEWSFAKISIINSKDGEIYTITTTPNKTAITEIYENTEYWIDAKIRVNGNTSNAFNTIEITSLEKNIEKPDFQIPERQIIIIVGIITLVGIVSFLKKII